MGLVPLTLTSLPPRPVNAAVKGLALEPPLTKRLHCGHLPLKDRLEPPLTKRLHCGHLPLKDRLEPPLTKRLHCGHLPLKDRLEPPLTKRLHCGHLLQGDRNGRVLVYVADGHAVAVNHALINYLHALILHALINLSSLDSG